MVISWWGALIGLALAIYLILKKLNPVYSPWGDYWGLARWGQPDWYH